MPYNVLLVEDHKIARDGIKAILERTPEFRIVGEAEDGSDAVSLCKKLRPDLVVMDIGLPGLNGIDATSEILRHCPSIKVTILSMYDDENSVVAAFRSGVRAFLLKNTRSARRFVPAREAGAAPGGGREDEQGRRHHAGFGAANRAHLSQDTDEEDRREQYRRLDPGGAGGRAHRLGQTR